MSTSETEATTAAPAAIVLYKIRREPRPGGRWSDARVVESVKAHDERGALLRFARYMQAKERGRWQNARVEWVGITSLYSFAGEPKWKADDGKVKRGRTFRLVMDYYSASNGYLMHTSTFVAREV